MHASDRLLSLTLERLEILKHLRLLCGERSLLLARESAGDAARLACFLGGLHLGQRLAESILKLGLNLLLLLDKLIRLSSEFAELAGVLLTTLLGQLRQSLIQLLLSALRGGGSLLLLLLGALLSALLLLPALLLLGALLTALLVLRALLHLRGGAFEALNRPVEHLLLLLRLAALLAALA